MVYFLTGNIRKTDKDKYVEVECSECGYKKWQKERYLDLNKPCNRLRHLRPDLVKLLDDSEDDFQYTPKSHKVAKWRCPCCNTKFDRTVSTVTTRGFNCPVCGVGISFPNRMMYEILKQLNIKFCREYEFSWAKKKYYDFYIDDINAIIEMHGQQHYLNSKNSCWGKPHSEIERNDLLKKELAIKNGIDNYIVIDASVSDYDYIFENIKNSDLSKFYCMSNIDKSLILNTMYSNDFVKEIIKLWESGETIKDIAKNIGMFHTTVKNIIKNAANGGLTFYDPNLEIKKNSKRIGLFNEKRIICTNDNIEHKSIVAASKYYDINTKPIHDCLKGRTKYCRRKNGERLVFKYV